MSKRAGLTTESRASRKKLYFSIMALVLALIALIAVSFAWFFRAKSLVTATNVIAPYVLQVGAGNKEAIEELYLGEIDVTKLNNDGTRSKDYVFCVYGRPALDYIIQLAHTTNINFRYEVYEAAEPNSEKTALTDGVYVDTEDRTWYFARRSNVTVLNDSNMLNFKSDNDRIIANEKYKDNTYDGYSKVQKNANALYLQSDVIAPTNAENLEGEFTHYYIIRISWEGDVVNNKETDIIYLTVEGQ